MDCCAHDMPLHLPCDGLRISRDVKTSGGNVTFQSVITS